MSSKPRITTHVVVPVRCVLAFAAEVARNAVAELRWHRQQSHVPTRLPDGASHVNVGP